jgi:hypothetical protein
MHLDCVFSRLTSRSFQATLVPRSFPAHMSVFFCHQLFRASSLEAILAS